MITFYLLWAKGIIRAALKSSKSNYRVTWADVGGLEETKRNLQEQDTLSTSQISSAWIQVDVVSTLMEHTLA